MIKTKNIVIFLFSSVLLFSTIDKLAWKLAEIDIKFFNPLFRIIIKVTKAIRGFLIFGIISSVLFLFAKESK